MIISTERFFVSYTKMAVSLSRSDEMVVSRSCSWATRGKRERKEHERRKMKNVKKIVFFIIDSSIMFS